MYSVHQHWDPLRVCAVGKSYSPEFYSFIKNTKVRNVMERIAEETEEDYQQLIKLLKSFNVETIRPTISNDYEQYLAGGRIAAPPMNPRDDTAMIGNKFYFGGYNNSKGWWEDFLQNKLSKITDDPNELNRPIPNTIEEYNNLPEEIKKLLRASAVDGNIDFWQDMISNVEDQGNEIIYGAGINTAMVTRIGKDLYHGTWDFGDENVAWDNGTVDDVDSFTRIRNELFPNYRNHTVSTYGHSDGSFCPVVPGLIFSLHDVQNYAETFPDWEIVYLQEQSWFKVIPFLELKMKNHGKWWVPGEELNDEFTEFVEGWLTHWVGYVEETVFDVNMLVIDEKNVVCNNYNDKVFEALERHGVTPHVLNFRHRYFWDGGLHCITSDLHREGDQKDFFPKRG